MRSNELLNEALREAASEAPSEEPINRCDSWRGPAQREAPRRAETTKENRKNDQARAHPPIRPSHTRARRARAGAGALMIDSSTRAREQTNHVGGTHGRGGSWHRFGARAYGSWSVTRDLGLSTEKYVV